MLHFDEILGRIDKYGAAAQPTQSSIVSEAASQVAANGKTGATGVEKELFRILSSSETLWTKGCTPVQTQLVFGKRGVVIPGRKAKENRVTEVFELGDEPPTEVPPQQCFDDVDPMELEEDVARVKLETDRAFFNHMLLSRPAASAVAPAQPFVKDAVPTPRERFVNPKLSDRRELIFGDKLKKFLKCGNKKAICGLMKDALDESGTDGIIGGVWKEVLAVINKEIVIDRGDVTTTAQILEDSCNYLHQLSIEHMQKVVEGNLERAERGGTPGTRALVAAFLKLGVDDPNAEDDNIEGLPIWEVTYHCVRAGDVLAAKDALARLQSFPQSASLVSALNHLASNPKLDADLKKKLKVEWRHNANHVKDRHKRALYAALLGFESTLADTVENWLWFKLFPLRVDPQLTPVLYTEVQKAVAIDYGEQHFMANGKTEYQYYFTALWLSGQFERAINLLFECDQMVDCVHVAILTHRLGYLRMTEKSTDEMLVVDEAEPTKCRLNLARLIVAYTKHFELVDVPRSLDYWFLLKGVLTPTGSDVFEMAVSRSVYLTGAVNEILGSLTSDGGRSSGLIDEYLEDPSDVINRVASDTELSGEWATAVGLYMLAQKPTNAAKLLSAEISESLRCDNVDRTNELVTVAEEFKRVQIDCQPSEYSTLSLLVDLCTLFDYCRKEDAEQAYHVSKTLRLIPADPESVPVLVGEFHLVPQKVREVLPDACLHLMRCVVDACIRSSTQGEDDLRQRDVSIFSSKNRFVKQVKAIVLYAASVPYTFPTQVTSRILQLQASLGV